MTNLFFLSYFIPRDDNFLIMAFVCFLKNLIFKARIIYSVFNVLHRDYQLIVPWKRKKEVLPWFTYPLVDYLGNLDLSDKLLFEYGSGFSIKFWSNCTKQIISVEDNVEFFNMIRSELPSNAQLKLRVDQKVFVQSINEASQDYDVIIIDSQKWRYECAKESIKHLKQGGMIILDDSDNLPYQRICEFFRTQDFIQIDFIGFKRNSEGISASSLFFKDRLNFKKKGSIQPNLWMTKNRNYKINQD